MEYSMVAHANHKKQSAASVAATHHMCIREQGPRPQSGLRG